MQPFMYALLCREFCHKFVGASGNLLRCRLGLRRREGEIGLVRCVRCVRRVAVFLRALRVVSEEFGWELRVR